MEKGMLLRPVGLIRSGGEGCTLVLDSAYATALRGLEGFSHAVVVWWFSGCDSAEERGTLLEASPYAGGPDTIGVFATRSPRRPNPVALSVCRVLAVDAEVGEVRVDWLDAGDGTPLLDIKPYTPSLDRVESPRVPAWCAGWPGSTEASEDFDWSAVFADE